VRLNQDSGRPRLWAIVVERRAGKHRLDGTERAHRLFSDLIFHHELNDPRLQAFELGAVFFFKAPLVHLERVDAAAVIFVGPTAEIRLAKTIFATRFRDGDFALEDIEDDRRFTLRRPSLKFLGFGFRLGPEPAPMNSGLGLNVCDNRSN